MSSGQGAGPSGLGGRPSMKRHQSASNGAFPASDASLLSSPAISFSEASAFKAHSAPGTPPMRAASPANGGYTSAAANAARADRFKSSGAGAGEEDVTALFHTMRHQREAIRQQYIKAGILPDPSKAQELDLAQKFKGTCPDMCPEFEQVEREMQKELDLLETLEGSSGKVDPARAVKKYRRPAAGREVPLPEDVRPPAVLKLTLDYLFHSLLPTSPFAPEFNQIQAFLWDRTRAIRQDFIVQSEGEDLTIECHERIARYHILTLHFRGGLANEDGSFGSQARNADGAASENQWSEQQELEQLRKTLRSLIEFYDDRRLASGFKHSSVSPNEGEFRAYNLLLHLRDPETLREVESLPTQVFLHPSVQSSLRLRSYAQKSNNIVRRGQPRNEEATLNWFSRFFREVQGEDVSYLQACLAENIFSEVRIGAVKALARCFRAHNRGVPVAWIVQALGMDDEQQAIDFAEQLGIEISTETDPAKRLLAIHNEATINENRPLKNPFSRKVVESKRGELTCQDVVDGRATNAAPLLPQPELPPSRPFSMQNSIKPPKTALPPAEPKKAAPAPALVEPPKASTSASTSKPESELAFPKPAPDAQPSAVTAFGKAISISSFNQPIAVTTPNQNKVVSAFGKPVSDLTFNEPIAFAPAKKVEAEEVRTPAKKPAPQFTASGMSFTPGASLTSTPSFKIPVAPVTITRPSASRLLDGDQVDPALTPSPRKQNEEKASPGDAARNGKGVKIRRDTKAQTPDAEDLQPQRKRAKLSREAQRQHTLKAAERIFERLFQEAAQPIIEGVAFEVVEDRKKSMRIKTTIKSWERYAGKMYRKMAGKIAESYARQAAQYGAANAFRQAKLGKVAFAHWSARTKLKQEWKKIRERSLQLDTNRKPKAADDPASPSTETQRQASVDTLVPANDETLAEAFTKAQALRSELWRPGVWSSGIYESLIAIYSSFKDVWPAHMQVVCSFNVSSADSISRKLSEWLQSALAESKYKFSGGQALEFLTYNHFRKQLPPSAGEKHPEVPLIIFECGNPSSSKEWTRVRASFQHLQHLFKKRANDTSLTISPKLLLVCWLADTTDHERAVLTNLPLNPKYWPEFRILSLEKSAVGAPVVPELLHLASTLCWKPHTGRASGLRLLVRDIWETFMNVAQTCEAYLSTFMRQDADGRLQVAMVWTDSNNLGNLVLQIARAVSRLKGSAEVDKYQVEVAPTTTLDGADSALRQLYQAAHITIANARIQGLEEGLQALELDLTSGYAAGQPFPLARFLEQLFSSGLAMMEKEWDGQIENAELIMKAKMASFALHADCVVNDTAALTATGQPLTPTAAKGSQPSSAAPSAKSSPVKRSAPEMTEITPSPGKRLKTSRQRNASAASINSEETAKGSPSLEQKSAPQSGLIDRLMNAMSTSRKILSID